MKLKLFEIRHRLSGMVVFSTEVESFKLAVMAAVKQKADLRYADLSFADLRSANLDSADLRYADLRYADLRYANLSSADLRYADLRYADLRSANLDSANLDSANLDFSSWGLSCKTFDAKAGDRLVSQIFCHWARLDVSQCSGTMRYMHRFIVGMFSKSMTNWFCKYRVDDVKEI